MFPVSTRIAFFAALPFLLMSAYSQAQNKERPAVIQALEAQGLDVIKEFDVGGSLRAFATAAGDRPIAVYVTSDGKAIVGTRVDASGESIDEKTLQNLVAKPMDDKAWTQLESANWVQDGMADAPRIIYAFSDANCPYCHKFWEAARPWVQAGKVQLRHLLVGVIKEDSPAKAAAILGARDSSAAFAENERNFDRGGIKPAKKVPDDVLKILDEHQMLMFSMGFRGTPAIVVRERDGQVKKFNGMPQAEQLAEVLGPR